MPSMIRSEVRESVFKTAREWMCEFLPSSPISAADNEEQSAELFSTWVAEEGHAVNAESHARVRQLILLTKTHRTPEHAVDWHGSGDALSDAHVVLDADMSILASSREVYDAYAAAIRREYAHVPADAFCRGRAAVLRGMIESKYCVFAVPELRVTKEATACANIMREVAALEQGIVWGEASQQ